MADAIKNQEVADKYMVTCRACGTRYQRSLWSIAHWDVDQKFTCPNCHRMQIIPAEEYINEVQPWNS